MSRESYTRIDVLVLGSLANNLTSNINECPKIESNKITLVDAELCQYEITFLANWSNLLDSNFSFLCTSVNQIILCPNDDGELAQLIAKTLKFLTPEKPKALLFNLTENPLTVDRKAPYFDKIIPDIIIEKIIKENSPPVSVLLPRVLTKELLLQKLILASRSNQQVSESKKEETQKSVRQSTNPHLLLPQTEVWMGAIGTLAELFVQTHLQGSLSELQSIKQIYQAKFNTGSQSIAVYSGMTTGNIRSNVPYVILCPANQNEYQTLYTELKGKGKIVILAQGLNNEKLSPLSGDDAIIQVAGKTTDVLKQAITLLVTPQKKTKPEKPDLVTTTLFKF